MEGVQSLVSGIIGVLRHKIGWVGGLAITVAAAAAAAAGAGAGCTQAIRTALAARVGTARLMARVILCLKLMLLLMVLGLKMMGML